VDARTAPVIEFVKISIKSVHFKFLSDVSAM
jgi:hypothetical protein